MRHDRDARRRKRRRRRRLLPSAGRCNPTTRCGARRPAPAGG
jgi:hypothetical protein